MVLSEGIQHFFAALSARDLLTIIKPEEQGFESLQNTLQGHYRSIGEAVLVLIALGILNFLVARIECERPAPNTSSIKDI
jgi:hypothetical protein